MTDFSSPSSLAAPSRLDRLESAWRRSDRIFTLLPPESILERPIALRHPFVFYMGHLPAFGWNQICRSVLKRPSLRGEFDDLFERGIDPLSETDPSARGVRSWPAESEIRAYRDAVRAALRDAYGEVAARHDARIYDVVIEHELMHHETLLYMMQRLDRAKRRPCPDGVPPPIVVASGRRLEKPVRVPAGEAILGADFATASFGWDNEFPEHRVAVPAFEVDRLPVTNARYREFVESGGYGDRELWSGEGWAAKEKYGMRHPRFWKGDRGAESFVVETLFEDVPFSRAESWPVSVSWIEANAYARWRGARLMTEAENHRAAYSTPDGGTPRVHPWGDEPPAARHGNFDFANWAPTPVGSHPDGASAFGVEDLVGDGWEWTRTLFAPFPGFRAWIESYPGYSADFFDAAHYVLKGASWATSKELVRRSFRNWFQPNYPYVFAKFRCVRPA
jgi:ergothioneine biosynthesis protein EgtB